VIKRIILILFFFHCVPERVEALPVGNPSEASFFNYMNCCEIHADNCELLFEIARLRIGYYGDFVFQRHLETVHGRHIDYSEIATNAAYIALNFFEVAELFTTVGASHFKLNTSLGPFNQTNPSPRFDFESSTAFSWSLGAHASLWEINCFTLGLMAQYYESRPKPRVLFVRTNVDARPDENSRRKYSEWQIGAGISCRYSEFFIPYAAVKYNEALWEFKNETFMLTQSTLATLPNLRSSKNLGVAVGLTLVPFECKKMALTIEGRFADETAAYFNALVQF
jgi:major outer membrane protein